MKGRIISGVTPQNKMVSVNNRFGNTNIKGQQGTTRVLYDSILLQAGQTEFRFFENAGSKSYPFTNIGAEGNRLNVGESFVVQKIYFATFLYSLDGGSVQVNNLQFGLGGVAGLYKGELSMQIANSQVIKQLPTTMFEFPETNVTGVNNQDIAFSTFTDIVIPPLLEYVVSLRSAYTLTVPPSDTYIACFMEGTAGILAPQTTF